MPQNKSKMIEGEQKESKMVEWNYKRYKFFYDQTTETAEAIYFPEPSQDSVGLGRSVVKLDNIKSKEEADSKLKEGVDKLYI